MSFQWRIINPRISLASSRLVNSQVSDISPPKTSRVYSLGITVSGPAMRAAKNPSSASTFIALPPLQPSRKSPRRSSSASVSGSGWAKVFTGFQKLSATVYDTTAPCSSGEEPTQLYNQVPQRHNKMPNAAQIATYEFIRSEIARLRGPQSHTPLSLHQVSPLADDSDNASFRVNGARVLIKPSGKVTDAGLPDCPTYACGLLPQYFLPAVAADLLSRGNPHKPFLHSQSHTPESFVAYLPHGTVLDKSQRDISQ